MFKVFEIDYHDRCYLIGEADDFITAKKIANEAYKKSNGEYPVFVEDGEKVVYNKK